ncbi:MAG TPA: NUDIX domain-containing protein [Candidatus Thermoplasmatota archaeon]|nr:NUDIX domain-containing protein [Candidatus Thermoplasmatota archaeon]
MSADAPVDVALAVVRAGDRVLLQRRDRAPFQGQWELPGGKVAAGEDPSQAAEREAREELGVGARAIRALGVHEHRYPQGLWVRLHAFEVALDGPPTLGEARRWVALDALAELDVLDGTRPVLARLR